MVDMGGLGDDAPDGWVMERCEIPLPKNRRAILEQLDSVLKQPKVQSIKIELGKPIVFSRFIRESEARQEEQLSGQMGLGELARNIHMEEYEPVGDGLASMFSMMMAVAIRRLHLTHIGLGVDSLFFDWLELDLLMFGGINFIGGAALVRDSEIPNDVMIFFAGHQRAGRVDEATYALKCHMLVRGGTDGQGLAGQDLGGRDRTGERSRSDGAVEDAAGGQCEEGGGVQPGEDQGAG